MSRHCSSNMKCAIRKLSYTCHSIARTIQITVPTSLTLKCPSVQLINQYRFSTDAFCLQGRQWPFSAGGESTSEDKGFFQKDVYELSNKEEASDENATSEVNKEMRRENLIAVQEDELIFLDDHNIKLTYFEDSSSPNPCTLPCIIKNIFSPTDQFTSRSKSNNEMYCKCNGISVHGIDIPPPVQHFSDIKLPDSITVKLHRYGAPTAVQAQSWSAALSGRDFIAVSQTGSGKTLSYLLPSLLHVSKQQQQWADDGQPHDCAEPQAVVLVPTRELAQQIMAVAEQYGPGVGVRAAVLYGGGNRFKQRKEMKRAKLVIATPGRLLDFYRQGAVCLTRVSHVVLDEADLMLDMGFGPQIRTLVARMRPDRQTLMCAATWPVSVRQLADQLLTEPVVLTVGSTRLSANPAIRQVVHFCGAEDKMLLLRTLIEEELARDEDSKVLVFVNTRTCLDYVLKKLRRKRIRSEAIHGDRDQRQRDLALNDFRKGYCSVLVATDLAARGLDIPSLGVVINYDYPDNTERYVHRIGRTGRAGGVGVAHTFFTTGDWKHAKALVEVLQQTSNRVDTRLLFMAAKMDQQERGGGALTLAAAYRRRKGPEGRK